MIAGGLSYGSSSRKLTVIVVTASTATPLSKVGWYRHWRTASRAAFVSSGSGELRTTGSAVDPSVRMTVRIRTTFSTRSAGGAISAVAPPQPPPWRCWRCWFRWPLYGLRPAPAAWWGRFMTSAAAWSCRIRATASHTSGWNQ